MMNALARTVKMVFAAVFLAARPSSPFAWKRASQQRGLVRSQRTKFECAGQASLGARSAAKQVLSAAVC